MVSSYKTQATALEERCNNLQKTIESGPALQKVIAGMFAKRYMIEIENFYGQYPIIRVLASVKGTTNIAAATFLNNGISNLDTLNQLLTMENDSFFAKIKKFFGGESFDAMVKDAISLQKRISTALEQFVRGTTVVWKDSDFTRDSEITKLNKAIRKFTRIAATLKKIKAADDDDENVQKIAEAFEKLAEHAKAESKKVDDMIEKVEEHRDKLKKFTKKLNGFQKTVSSSAESLTASVNKLLHLPAPVGLSKKSDSNTKEKNRDYRKIMSKLKSISSDMHNVNEALKNIKKIAEAISLVKKNLHAGTTIVDIRDVPVSLEEIDSLLTKLDAAILKLPS